MAQQKKIELEIEYLVQCVNGFEAAITNLKHYNITSLSCNLVGSGHLSFAMCGLSNYAQVTLFTAYAYTNSGIAEAKSNSIVSGELQHTKLNVFMDTLFMHLKAKYPN